MKAYTYVMDGWKTTIYATLEEVMERVNRAIGARMSSEIVSIKDENRNVVACRLMSIGSEWKLA